jgi:hypothetical protein
MKFDQDREGYTDGEAPLHFYYNREERVAHAPKLVQDYYRDGLKTKTGFFRVLVANRGNRLLLITLSLCIGVVVFFGFFGKKNEGAVAGVPVKLSAFSFEETVYVSVQLKEKEKNAADLRNKPVSVVVIVEALDADHLVIKQVPLSAKYDGKEKFLRTTIRDYDILSVHADVQAAGKSQTLSTPVEHH